MAFLCTIIFSLYKAKNVSDV